MIIYRNAEGYMLRERLGTPGVAHGRHEKASPNAYYANSVKETCLTTANIFGLFC